MAVAMSSVALARPRLAKVRSLADFSQSGEPVLGLGPISPMNRTFQHAAEHMFPTPVMLMAPAMSKSFSGTLQSPTASTISPVSVSSPSRSHLVGFGRDVVSKHASRAVGKVPKEQALAELQRAKEEEDSEKLRVAIQQAKRSGVPQMKVDKAEVLLLRLDSRDQLLRAKDAKDVEALRTAVTRANRAGVEDKVMRDARSVLEVLEAEEMLIIAMRNNVTGHLKKCIDIAVFKGARADLIEKARSMLAEAAGGDETKGPESAAVNSEVASTEARARRGSLFTQIFKAGHKEEDALEERLQVALRMQETGALQKAILLARRADEVAAAAASSSEMSVAEGTPSDHSASIQAAERMVAEIEVNMQLPLALKRQDAKKLQAILEKAAAWGLQSESLHQGQVLLTQLEANQILGKAIASKSTEQLLAAIEQARVVGLEAARIQKAEHALTQVQVREQLFDAMEGRDVQTLAEAIRSAQDVSLHKGDIEKATALLKRLSPTRQLVT